MSTSILAVLEQRAGSWNRMSFETLAAAQQFATELGIPAAAAVLGSGIDGLAAELASRRLEKVFAVEHDLLKDYTPDAYTIALSQLIAQAKPSIVVMPHTYQVRDFLPKLATSLGKVAVSDVISHRVDNGELVLVRQLFQGKVNADVRFAGDAPHFASLQAGAYRADQVAAGSAAVEKFSPRLAPAGHPHQAARPLPRIAARRGPGIRRDYRLGRPRHQGSGQYSRWCRSSPTYWAPNWRHRGPFAMPGGCPWNGRWEAPDKPSRPKCIWRWEFPEPSSIWWA